MNTKPATQVASVTNISRATYVNGIDELAKVLQVKLRRLINKEDLGIRDSEGKPVRSIRHLARHIGNEKGYAYISGFANDNKMPCITILNQLANALDVKYTINNF